MQNPTRKVNWSPWVELKEWDVCYGIMPKNASSAFYESLRRHYQMPRSLTKGVHIVDAHDRLRYVAQPSTVKARFIVRHPLDRFESLWRSKCRDHHGTIGGHPIRGMTPEQLFEYIQKHDDPHWRMQHPYVTTLDKEPTLVPIENFKEQLRLDTGIALWTVNSTKEEPHDRFSPELLSDVTDYYQMDMFVYERAVRQWEMKHGEKE